MLPALVNVLFAREAMVRLLSWLSATEPSIITEANFALTIPPSRPNAKEPRFRVSVEATDMANEEMNEDAIQASMLEVTLSTEADPCNPADKVVEELPISFPAFFDTSHSRPPVIA